ncbi:unnamed protein product [Owenia fusiformis]|uniref:Double-strand break repair protein n=1 Tax=Owenia fusiformis TaxID=6347 RepID=A0A8J1Y008_OWEFU|nr:unnamed protein product [Owenia fusiformis]
MYPPFLRYRNSCVQYKSGLTMSDDEDVQESRNGNKEVMKILLATDCHLGYAEKDAIRGNDSLVTFQEIMQIATEQEVDFVLLGGDLFHENKPSRKTLHGAMEILRKYCMGDRPCQVEFLSDQSANFKQSNFPVVNYEDPNLNISMPVFSIHGNHDDPAGFGNLCALDMLHTAGLVNYFGKVTSLEEIEISPLLLQKGNIKVSIHGLGALRDERLHRLFTHKKVKMLRPKEDQESWFNMFVIHQNHAKHGPTNYIPEQFLDDFLDLIFWGHEHECLIEPRWNGEQNFYVTQPGSSVATSLSEGEMRQKHDEDLTQSSLNLDDPDISKQTEVYCSEIVDELLEKAERDHTGNPKQPKQPLIRLRVFYKEGEETFSTQRFGQKYVDRVANPKDIIAFHKKKIPNADNKDNIKDELDMGNMRPEALETATMDDLVKQIMANDKNGALNVLTERGMGAAVQEFVDKENRDAISLMVECQIKKTKEHLRKKDAKEDQIDNELEKFKEERRNKAQEAEEVKEALRISRENKAKEGLNDNGDNDEDDDNSDINEIPEAAKNTRGRGRGRGRGSRGGRGTQSSRGRGRGKQAVVEVPDEKKSMSIKDAFSSQAKSKQKSNTDVIYCDDSGEDSDNPFNNTGRTSVSSRSNQPLGSGDAKTTQRSRTNGQRPTQKKKGLTFDDDSDDEEFIPKRKRKK